MAVAPEGVSEVSSCLVAGLVFQGVHGESLERVTIFTGAFGRIFTGAFGRRECGRQFRLVVTAE